MIDRDIDIQKAIAILKKDLPGLLALYIFGSYTSGEFGPLSDIDLAFRANTEISPLNRFELQENIARAFNRNVDLVDMNKAGLMTVAQVIYKGNRVFEKNELEAEEYEMNMVSKYYTYKDDIQPILDQIKKDGIIYG